MKMHILPPSRVKIGGSYILYIKGVCAWSVVSEVAGGYRYWRAVASETQRDLLRFAALNSVRVSVGVTAGRTPVFYFDRELVNAWLDGGGRSLDHRRARDAQHPARRRVPQKWGAFMTAPSCILPAGAEAKVLNEIELAIRAGVARALPARAAIQSQMAADGTSTGGEKYPGVAIQMGEAAVRIADEIGAGARI